MKKGKKVPRKKVVESSSVSMLVAVDPGKVCGIAWGPSALESWDSTLVGSDQVEVRGNKWFDDGETVAVLRILARIKEMRARVVVVESFALVPGRVLTNDALIPVRLIGAIRFALNQKWFSLGGGRYVEQSASQAKTVVTDARLKALGLWVPGKQHARDALRHLVLAQRRVQKGDIEI